MSGQALYAEMLYAEKMSAGADSSSSDKHTTQSFVEALLQKGSSRTGAVSRDGLKKLVEDTCFFSERNALNLQEKRMIQEETLNDAEKAKVFQQRRADLKRLRLPANIHHDQSQRLRYVLQGNLPEGLSFDRQFGFIYGTPTVAFKKQLVTVTLESYAGQVRQADTFSVYVPEKETPVAISYPSVGTANNFWRHPVKTFTAGQASSTDCALVTGGPVKRFLMPTSQSFVFPDYLTFDEVTGAIGGFLPTRVPVLQKLEDKKLTDAENLRKIKAGEEVNPLEMVTSPQNATFQVVAEGLHGGTAFIDIEIEITPHRVVSHKLIDEEVQNRLREIRALVEGKKQKILQATRKNTEQRSASAEELAKDMEVAQKQCDAIDAGKFGLLTTEIEKLEQVSIGFSTHPGC